MFSCHMAGPAVALVLQIAGGRAGWVRLMTTGRFGEYLIQQGKLTAGQLAQALERQVIFGARLGTTLVELGFIRDVELPEALSRHLGMAPAQPDVFDNVPAELIGLLPRELAGRPRALQLRQIGGAP